MYFKIKHFTVHVQYFTILSSSFNYVQLYVIKFCYHHMSGDPSNANKSPRDFFFYNLVGTLMELSNKKPKHRVLRIKKTVPLEMDLNHIQVYLVTNKVVSSLVVL